MLNIKQFNPAADGKTLDTEAFQKALDQLAKSGGELFINPGKYVIGSLCIHSNTCITLAHGAELIASVNYEHYRSAESSVIAEQSTSAMLFANKAENITIRGQGVINGNGAAFNEASPDEMGYYRPFSQRPRVIIFEDCVNTTITEINIINAPMWTIHLISCDVASIRNITIKNDVRFSNNDCIDIDGCQNVRVSHCHLSAADDGVCLKTSQRPKEMDRPCKNIVVSDCVIHSHSCGIKIGTESYNDFENISISNCVIADSNRGIGLISRDGGHIRNINISNIISNNQHVKACHWGKADPIYMSVRYRDPAITPGNIENVYLNNIRCHSEGAINLHSEIPEGIRNINFNNVSLTQKISHSEDAQCFDIRPPCHPIATSNDGMNNAYALDAETGRPWGVHEYPSGLPAFFASGINREAIHLEGLTIHRPETLPENWSQKPIIFIK